MLTSLFRFRISWLSIFDGFPRPQATTFIKKIRDENYHHIGVGLATIWFNHHEGIQPFDSI